MQVARRIVLHSRRGLRSGLDVLVAEWMREGVRYVGVIGVDAEDIEEAIDWFCIGDGTDPYDMLTAAHNDDETLGDAILFASELDLPGDVAVVDF
nr:hypothetical protein [Chiayiivirga flava]